MKALTVKIGADAKGFNTAIDGTKGKVEHFSKTTKRAMLGIAAATAGAISVFKSWSDNLDHASKLAQRFDMSVESMQRLGFIAKKAGASIEEIADALKDSNIKAEEAMRGSKAAAEGFEAMGINAAEFINLNAQDKIEALADGFIKAEEAGLGFSSAQAIVGGSAMKLLPLLRQGSAELRKQADEAKVVSSTVVKNAERMNDVFETIKNKIGGFAGEAIQTLLAMGISIGVFADKSVNRLGYMFKQMADSAGVAGKLIQNALMFNFDGVEQAYNRLGEIADKSNAKLAEQLEKIDKARDLALVDLYKEGDNGRPKITATIEEPPVVEVETPTALINSMKSLGDMFKRVGENIIKSDTKSTTASAKKSSPSSLSAITAKRGQEISSLASHGGGRGFKGAMSGLTKVALESQKYLATIAANTGNPHKTILG